MLPIKFKRKTKPNFLFSIIIILCCILISQNTVAQELVLANHSEPLCPKSYVEFTITGGGCTLNLATSQEWTVTNGKVKWVSSAIIYAQIEVYDTGKPIVVEVKYTCVDGTPKYAKKSFRVRSLSGENLNIAVNSPFKDNNVLGNCEKDFTIKLDKKLISAASDVQNSVYADAYIWSIPAGFKIGNSVGPTNVLTFEPQATITSNGCSAGVVKVVGTIGYYNCAYVVPELGSPTKTNALSINVQRQPNTVNITAPSVVKCEDVFSASVPSFGCATNYTWTSSSDWVITSGQGTANVSVNPLGNASNGILQVAVTLDCGTVINGTANIAFDKTVAQPTIIGASTFCNNETKPITATVSSGNPHTYVWSATGSALINGQSTFTFDSPTTVTSHTVNLTSPTSGNFETTVTVTVSNLCGGNSTSTHRVWIGKPSIPVVNLFVIPNRASGTTSDLYVCPNKELTIKFFQPPLPSVSQGVTHYSWQFTCGTRLSTSADTRSILVKTAMAYNPCEEVWLRAHNSCGVSDWFKVNVDFANDCGGRLSTNSVRLFSNPSNAHTFVEIDNLPQVNYNQDTENASAGFTYQIKVYDQAGTLRKEFNTNKVRKKIVTSDLPVGQYRVIVSDEFETTEKILLVNR